MDTVTKVALDAALEVDGRVHEAEAREYLREIVEAVLAAVGHYTLLVERDQLLREAKAWRRVERAIEPERRCVCSDGSNVRSPDRVPTCAHHGGKTWWIVAEAREARAALDREKT